eukprot:gene18225-20043_t
MARFVLLIVVLVSSAYASDPTADLDTDCKFTITSLRGSFQSLNYPSNYPDSKKCGWILEATGNAADIKVTFVDFVLEPNKRCSVYDHVFIYTQEIGSSVWNQISPPMGYCGTMSSFYKFQSCKRMLIKFVSDDYNAFKGFNATYKIEVTQVAPRIQCLGKHGDSKCNKTLESIQNSQVKIGCNATGTPPPTYTWLMENSTSPGQFIPAENSRFYAALTGVLTIRSLKKSDAKKYRCIASNKHGSNASDVTLIVKSECLCSKVLTTNSYEYAPYTRYPDVNDATKSKGIFYVILQKMVAQCCGNCSDGHGPSSIKWEDNVIVKQKSMAQMKVLIETGNYQISFPVKSMSTNELYSTNKWFVPVVENPGTAFIIKGASENSNVIFNSVLNGWPILVLTVLMAVLAGIIMWMLDTYWNEEQFPRSFTEGIIEGFWWAFVTMTTVGYGDIAPVGVPGRLFAIMWVLTGLVIISIFTGVITTALNVNTLTTDIKLYGTKVGALTNTTEFNLGIKRNAEMLPYTTYEAMSSALKTKKVKAVLIDSYVAAHHPSLFGSPKARVNKIIKGTKTYGFVVPNDNSIKSSAITCFRNYASQQTQSISSDVAANTQTLQVSSTSAAESNAANLFNGTSPLFVNAVISSLTMLAIFSILGLLFEYCYLKPKKLMLQAARNLEMVETPEIREMAKRAQVMKEILLFEIKEFHERWKENVVNLRKKHQDQQKELLSRGMNKNGRDVPPAKEAIELDAGPSPRANSSQAFIEDKSEL